MPNENLKNMLALSKKMEEKTNHSSSSVVTKPKIMTQSQLDEQINVWDEEVFGKSKPTTGYDPHDEMKKIKERQTEGVEKTLNNPILQEVFNNPYNMDLDVVSGLSDPKRVELDEKLKDKYQGLAGALKINETIEKKDKAKLEERKQQTLINSNINYETLQEIIENVIDKKFAELKNSILTESVNHNKPNKTTMIMLEDNFTFVDNEGNMYKCGELKYVGKAKLKNKQN